jgi:CHAD domain-containing protein
MSVEDQYEAAIQGYCAVLKREARRVRDGRVDALHRARVASRRLREGLVLLAADPDSHKLKRQLKKVTRRLGNVREVDVLMSLIDEYRHRARYSSTALQEVGTAIAHERQSKREELTTTLFPSEFRRLARRVERALERRRPVDAFDRRRGARDPKQLWRSLLEARVIARATRVASALNIAGTLYAPDRLHQVRVSVKKLRYALELLGDEQHAVTSDHILILRASQDLLGRLHDIEVLIDRTRRVQASLTPPDVVRWRELSAFAHALEDDCRRLHARFLQDRGELIAIATNVAKLSLAPSPQLSAKR